MKHALFSQISDLLRVDFLLSETKFMKTCALIEECLVCDYN